MKSFSALHNVALGFRPENVLLMSASVPSSDLASARRATRFFKQLAAGVSAMPGVGAAGAIRTPPGTVNSWGGYWIDHLPEAMSVSPGGLLRRRAAHLRGARNSPPQRPRFQRNRHL